MRNLKKILALVLAMVMTFSVMSVAGAFSDDEKFTANYAEAAEVLEGLGVFKGYADGSFKPEKNITRAEVAALIYRIATGDTFDANVDLYKYNGQFKDVPSTHWAAGYINYCANAEYIRGTSDTTFAPEKNVTGYQALAMILRVVGYDKNKEFAGSDWEIQVARIANDLQITGTVAGVSLRDAAPRQIVAELLFQALVNANVVNYTPALGYQPVTILGEGTQTLGTKVFGLYVQSDTQDNWGRPSYTYEYDYGTAAVIEETPVLTSRIAVTECDIAAAAGIPGEHTYKLYTNGNLDACISQYKVQATDTVGKLGAQGRILEVYDWDRIVMIDTLLATVEKVTAAKYDAAGHVITPAKLTLNVYDGSSPSGYTQIVQEKNTNWEYTEGQALLVNAYQDAAGKVILDGAKAKYIEIKSVATPVAGTQTTIWVRANQHTINGATYYDNNRLHLNQAGTDSTKNYNWYFDADNNVIGSIEIAATYTYGILKNMIWNVGLPGYATATLIDPATGAESTVNVDTIDGSANKPFIGWQATNFVPTYSVSAMISPGFSSTGSYAYVGNDSIQNGYYNGFGLYRVEALSNGFVNLDGYQVIGYKHAGTITTNATYFEGEGGAGDLVYVDDNTVFTVKVGNEYKQFVGKANVPSFQTGTARVFYVRGADNVADFVYIKDGNFTYAGMAYVMAMSDTYKTMFEGTVGYDYMQYGYVGTELKGTPINGVDTGVKALSTGDQFVRTLTARVAIPHYVTYNANGTVATAAPFTPKVGTATDGTSYVKLADPGFSGTTLLYNKAVVNKDSYNTTQAVVCGDYTSLSDVTDWSDVNIYVVYKTVGGINYATIIYAMDKRPGEQDSTVSGPEKPDADKAVLNFQVQMIDASGKVLNTISVATQKVKGDVAEYTSTYEALIKAMNGTMAVSGWTNADGAVDFMTAMGIYSADLTGVAAQTVKCAAGESVTVTYTVKVQA